MISYVDRSVLLEYCKQVILLSHSNLIDNSWKGLSDKDKYYFAEPFDGSGILEICALPDEPALTRFKVCAIETEWFSEDLILIFFTFPGRYGVSCPPLILPFLKENGRC
jgi:hypothetical protein